MSIGELLHPDPHALLHAGDRGKFMVEAHRRLSAPLTAFSFAMVALVAVVSGAFSRHGNVVRPLVAIMAVVGLVVLGLVAQNIATRTPALIPLIWLQALLPGLICCAMLFGRELRLARSIPDRAAPRATVSA